MEQYDSSLIQKTINKTWVFTIFQ